MFGLFPKYLAASKNGIAAADNVSRDRDQTKQTSPQKPSIVGTIKTDRDGRCQGKCDDPTRDQHDPIPVCQPIGGRRVQGVFGFNAEHERCKIEIGSLRNVGDSQCVGFAEVYRVAEV